jgi:2-C-methyl-D-erythritol 4-phosphate cytidylyltransferase
VQLGWGRCVCERKKNEEAMSRTFQYSNPLARTIIFIVVIVLANCGFTTSFTRISSGDNGTFRRRSGSIVVTSGTSAGTKLVVGTKQRRFAEKVQATGNANNEVSLDIPDMSDVGFIILAGGTGSRMKATMPKQFLTLRGKPVLHHSMDLFLEQLPAFLKSRGRKCPSHVILVLDPMYQPEYQKFVDHYGGRLTFASPGKERQGSVENGLHALRNLAANTKYAAIHDSARPLVTIQEVCNVVNDAKEVGAAVLGVPCKATIKESEDGAFVTRTIPRSRLWEVHTPQGEQ